MGAQRFQELLCWAASDWLPPRGQEGWKAEQVCQWGGREAHESPGPSGVPGLPYTLGQGVPEVEPLN